MKINPKEMEIYKLCDKKLRVIILRKLNELQEYTNRQLNKIRKTKQHKQNEKFIREIEIIKKEPKRFSVAKE